PHRCISVDPRWKRRDIHTMKSTPLIVVKKLRLAPLDQEEVLVSVVVIIPPYRAHRNAGACLIHIRKAKFTGYIFERSIIHVAIEPVLTSDRAVRYIQIRPSITVKIDNGD